jgi:hypothetical protein
MARPLRVQYPRAFYHVTAQGNKRQALFRSSVTENRCFPADADRDRFLGVLAHGR